MPLLLTKYSGPANARSDLAIEIPARDKPAKVRACRPNADSTDNNSKSQLGRHSSMNDGWSVVREGSPNRRKVVMIDFCLYCTPGSLLLEEEGDEDEDDEEMSTKSDIGLIEGGEGCV